MVDKISQSQYATRRKELLSFVKQLRSIGAQADLDLPRVTVIGNQSAGKSSVVEAISGINVPRDAGTCTRCPMECRLSSASGPWSCQVSIRWEFDECGNRLEKVHEEPFGDVISQPEEVEVVLRRAQAAVLNPAKGLAWFLEANIEELKGGTTSLPFSRNIVCVDLEGPELTDLSFIDLPGIIQNAEPEIVNLVEGMVISHIRGNGIILVALPMTDDIENQKALRLARQVDPEGKRTIGVMTKPDMLTSGSTKALELWQEVIEGRRHPLIHGYYCTKQPNDVERSAGISSASARQLEMDYFNNNSPWKMSMHKGRFGTNNLVSTLSTLLVQIIKESLPNLRIETQVLLAACITELDSLPPPMNTEPATCMLNLVTSLVRAVEQYTRGEPTASHLIHANRDAFAKFKIAIRKTAPNFWPFLDKDLGREKIAFDNAMEEEDMDIAETGDLVLDTANRVSLTDMRAHIRKSITRELPDNIPFQAKVALITSFQNKWESSTKECFDVVKEATSKVLFECSEKEFGRYPKLHQLIKQLITELVEHHYNDCAAILVTMLRVELTPFTQNSHYLQTCTHKWLAKYKDARVGHVGAPGGDIFSKKRKLPIEAGNSQRTPTFGNGKAQERSVIDLTNVDPTPTKLPTLETFTFNTYNSNPTTNRNPAVPVSPPRRQQSSSHSHRQQPQPAPYQQSYPAQLSPQRQSFSSTPLPASSSTSTTTTSVVVPKPPSTNTENLIITKEPPTAEEKLNTALAALAELGYNGLSVEDLGKLNPPDEYETELQVMAEVRGYFQVSYKRVIDNIPSLVDFKFVKAISTELQNHLITGLGLGSGDAGERCAAFLAEDPMIVKRREELKARKIRLETVKTELQNFGL